jgi:hypothetical protein
MKVRKFLLAMLFFLILLGIVFSQEETSGGEVDYSQLAEQEKIDYLMDNFGMDVTGGLGNVRVEGGIVIIGGTGAEFDLKGAKFSGAGRFDSEGNELILTDGTLSLGSKTSSELKIIAEEDTLIAVAEGEGYSGEILAGGVFEIKSFEEQVVKIFSGTVELVKGKIKKSEELEALGVKGIFADVPAEMEIAMEKGKVEGNKFTSKDVCVDTHCFHSKETLVEVTGEEIKIIGEGVVCREEGQEKRVVDSKEGVVVWIKTKRWGLSEGTRVIEIKAGEASSVIKVSKETTYFPEHEREVCGRVAGSCIVIDKFNSIRVRGESDNMIKIDSLKLVPSLIVDKLDGGSKIEYVEHYLRDKKGLMVKLIFNEEGAKAYPPRHLKDMKTRVVFDYENAEGEARALEFDSLGKKILVEGKTIGQVDEMVAENYYATKLGEVISSEERQEYLREIKAELGGESFNKMSEEEKDFLMLLIHHDSGNKKYLTDWALSMEVFIKNLPPEIDRGALFRDAMKFEGKGLWESSLVALGKDVEVLSKNYLLNSQLTELYKKGELSYPIVSDFNNWLMPKIELDSPEKGKAYISLIGKLPQDSYRVKKLGIQSSYLNDLFDNYYTGRKDKDFAFLEGMEGLIVVEEAKWGKLNLDLPSGLEKEELPEFLAVMYNLEKAKGGFDYKEKNRLKAGIELWEKAPSLRKQMEEWDGEKEKLGEYFIFAGRVESSKKIEEGKEILEAFEEALGSPKISEETKEALKNYYARNSGLFSVMVNRLHNQPRVRKGLVRVLPEEMKIEILSQSLKSLGGDNGLYRSSEELIFRDLVDSSGGEKRFIDFLERRGYNLEHEKTGKVLRMLAACGQLDKVIPKEETKRREVYSIVLKTLAEESFSRAGGTVSSILKNPELREDFAETLLEEYELVEGPEKDFLQYTIRQNKEYLDEGDTGVRDALDNPNQRVMEVEKKLIVPIDTFIENSEKREGVPVLKVAVVFTDVEEDPEMEASFERFKNVGGEFKLVETTEKSYILERKGKISGEEVIFRMEVFRNPEGIDKIREDAGYFMLTSKGHSFSSERIWENQQGYKNEVPRIGYIGSCIGFNGVSEKKLTQIYENTAFFATSSTVTSSLNNKNILNIFNGLEEGYRDYGKLTSYVKEKAGKGDKVTAWSGPETFFVDDLKGD